MREIKRAKLIAIRLSMVNYHCFKLHAHTKSENSSWSISYIKLELTLRRSHYLNMAMKITWSLDYTVAEVWMSIFFYVIQTEIRCYHQHIQQIWSSKIKLEIEFILFKAIHMDIINTSNHRSMKWQVQSLLL